MSTNQCAYSGLAITHPEAFVSSDPESDFHADFVKLGNNMLLQRSYGYADSPSESELLLFIDNFIEKHFKSENKIVYIEDYAFLTGVAAKARKNFITYFINNDFVIGMVLYQLPYIFKISFNLAKKLRIAAAKAHAVNTYEQAFDLARKLIAQSNTSFNTDDSQSALISGISGRPSEPGTGLKLSGFFHRFFAKLKGVNVFFTQKAKQQLAKQCSEELIKFIATIDWQMPGLPPGKNIMYDDVSSKKVFDAISFVKSEIDTLMEERDTVEAVLRESETRYRLLVEHAKAGFLEYDYKTNQIISVNEELIHMTGYSEQELLGKAPIELLTEESQKIFLKRLLQITAEESISQDIVYQFSKKNGETLWVLLNSNISYQKGRPEKASVVITDISKLKHTENQLLEYQEKLKRLSIRLSMIEEDQRRAMASQLHETIGQELFVMQLQLNAFGKSIDSPALLALLEPINEQLLKIIKETKDLTFDLSPPVLYDFGFQEALKTLGETIELKHNIHVQTYFEGEMDTFDDEIKAILYRNIKELIHNSVKHADAKNIIMRLKNSQSGLHIELCDDGVGFDAGNYINETSSHDGFGLFDIREKLNHLGGCLIIDSAPGQGTSISMQVPLQMRN
ncbi:MAG: PAS domain S-box protein [Desulfobacteraceae bacterium]|nr:PAS domain S-box protein [Desulfobacteraceae bacterium]